MFGSSTIDPFYGCLATQHYLGGAGFKALVTAAGSAREVYALSEAGLREATPAGTGVSEKMRTSILDSIRKGPDLEAWEKLEASCRRLEVALVIPGMPGFPQGWDAGAAPPPLLYLRGDWRMEDVNGVAVVGTRGPTEYGRKAAYTLAQDLAEAGWTVVSGLAVGVDALAHEGALRAGGRTLAVIGCGHDIPYPPENRDLYERIAENGAVVSEHPPGTEPQRMFFPRRNKIISALSRGVVVVEAGAKSGALLTADDARREGKPVFAVPGNLFAETSVGTHALLRSGAALLAASAADVITGIAGFDHSGKGSVQTTVRPAVRATSAPVSGSGSGSRRSTQLAQANQEVIVVPNEPADPLLSLWTRGEACGLDALVARATERGLWTAEQAAGALLESLLRLEMTGRIERLPGPAYRLVVSRE